MALTCTAALVLVTGAAVWLWPGNEPPSSDSDGDGADPALALDGTFYYVRVDGEGEHLLSWRAGRQPVLEATVDYGLITFAAVSPNGKYLAYATLDGELRLRDLTTREERPLLVGESFDDFCADPQWMPDSRTLLVGREGGSRAMLDVDSGRLVEDPAFTAPGICHLRPESGTGETFGYLDVTDDGDGYELVVADRGNTTIAEIAHDAIPGFWLIDMAALSPGGAYACVAAVAEDTSMGDAGRDVGNMIIDTATGLEAVPLPHADSGEYTSGCLFTGTDHYIARTGTSDGSKTLTLGVLGDQAAGTAKLTESADLAFDVLLAYVP